MMFHRVVIAMIVCHVLGSVLMTCQAEQAGKSKSLKKLLAKVAKAHGGLKNLRKYNAYSATGKGVFYGMGEGIKFSGEWKILGTDYSRMALDMTFNGQPIQMVEVAWKNKGWVKITGLGVKKMTKAQIKDKRHENYTGSLLPKILLNPKGSKLVHTGSLQVKGKEAIGIKVSKKGRPDVILYFDKKTSLLVKTERTGIDPKGGNEFTEEVYYSNYKKFNGVNQATRIRVERDGKLYVTATVSNVQMHKTLAKDIFAAPQGD